MTRLPAANKAYRAQLKPDRKLMTTTNPWNICTKGLATNHPAQAMQDVWRMELQSNFLDQRVVREKTLLASSTP